MLYIIGRYSTPVSYGEYKWKWTCLYSNVTHFKIELLLLITHMSFLNLANNYGQSVLNSWTTDMRALAFEIDINIIIIAQIHVFTRFLSL